MRRPLDGSTLSRFGCGVVRETILVGSFRAGSAPGSGVSFSLGLRGRNRERELSSPTPRASNPQGQFLGGERHRLPLDIERIFRVGRLQHGGARHRRVPVFSSFSEVEMSGFKGWVDLLIRGSWWGSEVRISYLSGSHAIYEPVSQKTADLGFRGVLRSRRGRGS